jgi:hypothetical protein
LAQARGEAATIDMGKLITIKVKSSNGQKRNTQFEFKNGHKKNDRD